MTKITDPSGVDVFKFEYDANGNMVVMNQRMSSSSTITTEYIYDSENRLASVKKNAKIIAEYTYDGDGGRTKKQVFGKNPNSSLQTQAQGVGFTFTPRHLGNNEGDSGLGSDSSEPRGSLEYETSSTICGERMPPELCRQKRIEAAQANTTRYVGSLYEEQGQSKTRHIFLGGTRIASVTTTQDTGHKVSYTHTNHLGSTNVVTDENGEITELIEYEPWGTFATHEKYGDDSDTAWYYFTGKPLDDETGLYYFGARYYNPVIGRFLTPDTIVQDPYNPQTLNRYSYTSNNPINRIDPDGHKWSWGNFWKSFAGAFVGVVAGILLGPAGFYLVGTTMAAIIGGAVGGAITGGLQGGWKGAMFGALAGGALGGFGSWGVQAFGPGFGLGMMAAGGGLAAATGNLDSFAGGLAGGIGGYLAGTGFVNANQQQFANYRAGKGFVSDYTAKANEFAGEMQTRHALNVNQRDTTVGGISRPLAKNKAGDPGSLTGPRHDAIVSDKLSNGGWEMGPQDGIIQTTNTADNLSGWGTHITTEKSLGLGGSYARSFDAQVNFNALQENISLYETTFAGKFSYNALNHNSNFAVNSVIYGAGGDVPVGYRAPGFPTTP